MNDRVEAPRQLRQFRHLLIPALWLLLPLLIRPAFAAGEQGSEKTLAAFPITRILADDGETLRLEIEGGQADGIVAGWSGNSIAVRKGETEGFENADFTGWGEAELVGVETSVVVIHRNDTGRKAGVLPGDVVQLHVLVPKLARRSVLFDLARFRIRIRGREHPRPWFTFRALRSGETPEDVDAILSEMLTGIRRVGVEFAEMEQLKVRLDRGRYAGRVVAEVLVAATREDLVTFFRFVLNYPGKYYGHEWAVEEVFATWVINFAPYSLEEVLAEVLLAPDDEAAGEIVARHQAGKTTDELTRLPGRLRRAAEDAARRREFELAWRTLGFAERAATILDTPGDTPWLRFSRAWILDLEGRVVESLAAYRAVLEMFRHPEGGEEQNRWGEALGLHNLGYGLQRTGDYAGAMESYRAAYAIKQELSAGQETRALSLRVIGDLLVELGSYGEAVRHYREAQELCRQTGTREGLTEALSGEAGALEALGQNDVAKRVYEELLVEHRRVGARASEARTLESIGTQHWTLGDYRAARPAFESALLIYRELEDRGGEAVTLLNLGRLKKTLGDNDGAEEFFRQSLAIERELGRRSHIADALLDLGGMADRRGDFDRALALFEEALGLQRGIANLPGEAAVHELLGDLRFNRLEFKQALADFDRAVELNRRSGAKAAIAGALRRRATLHQVIGDFSRAAADLEEAGDIAVALQAPSLHAEILLDQSSLERSRREPAKAVELTQKALEIARNIESLRLKVRCRRTLCEELGADSRFDEALAEGAAALELLGSSELVDPAELARTHRALGDVHADCGRFDTAREEFEQALAAARSCGATDEAQNALYRIGDMAFTKGDLATTREKYAEAMEITAGNEWQRIQALGRLAALHDELGEPGKALLLRREQVEGQARLANHWGRAQALNGLADTLYRNGDLAAARQFVREALTVGEEHADPRSVATMHATAGQIETELGNHDPARLHFEAALAVFREYGDAYATAEVLLYLGLLNLDIGTPESLPLAEAQLREARAGMAALKAGLKEAEAAQAQARLALETGAPARALEILDAAPGLGGASRHVEWRRRFMRARAESGLDRLDEALAETRGAIAVLEEVRAAFGADERAQREFLRSRVAVYEFMAELLGRLIEREEDPERRKALIEEALEFIGRAHFEILNDGTRDLVGTGSEAEDRLLGRFQDARREVARLEKKIEEARATGNQDLTAELTRVLASNLDELAELHANLTAADDDLGSRLKFDPRYLDQVDALPEGARLVVYFTGETHLFLWVFSSDGFLTWKRHGIGREAIAALVTTFRDRIDEVIDQSRTSKGRGFGAVAEANEKNPEWYRENIRATRLVLRELYDQLIAPVKAEIGGADPLLILPYGQLNYLPFEALISPDGTFLGEHQRMAYFVHSEHLKRTLARLYQEIDRKQDVLVAFADPVGKLSESLEEVAEIGAFFPEHEVHSRLTGTATENRLKEIREDGTILHFATHGFLNGARPSDTWLELSAAPPSDGRLMQKEIWPRMKREVPPFRAHNIRLVVLSACETARAQNAPEAEVLGMPDAFVMAGSPAVLASLWSVHSWSTTDLMVEFYRRLTEAGSGTEPGTEPGSRTATDLGTALLGARRALLSDREHGRYAHPYYWSAFLLFGDWR